MCITTSNRIRAFTQMHAIGADVSDALGPLPECTKPLGFLKAQLFC